MFDQGRRVGRILRRRLRRLLHMYVAREHELTGNCDSTAGLLFTLFGFCCFSYVGLATALLVWSNANQLNSRSGIQWYFPLWWVLSDVIHFFLNNGSFGLVANMQCGRLLLVFKKMGQSSLFHLFSVFLNKHYNFYNKYMWKMSIQYTVPGFEPTTFRTWVSSHNHWTRALLWFLQKSNLQPFVAGRNKLVA